MTSLVLSANGVQGPRGDGGIPFAFSQETAAGEPGAGIIRLNHLDPALATEGFLSRTSAAPDGGADIAASLLAHGGGTSDTKFRLRIAKQVAPDSNFIELDVTSVADSATHLTLSFIYRAHAGVLADGDAISLVIAPTGDKGSVDTIADNLVSNAMLADMANGTIKGRATSGAGDPEDLTAAQVRTVMSVDSSAEVDAKVAGLVAAAPAALDTLNELAMALGNDQNFATTMANALAAKAELVHDHNGVYEPVDAQILRADTDQNLAAGYTATADDDGTISSGTYTPAPSDGNFKRIINAGAFTLAAPTAGGDYALIIQITNSASAGAITLSGFSKTGGEALTTTDGDNFFVYITRVNGFVSANVEALQ